MRYTDRQEAGVLLSQRLTAFRSLTPVVFGLARGGAVVAKVVSESLNGPLDVLVVKKIPSPDEPELALGALAPEGVFVCDWKLTHRLGADEDYIKTQIQVLGRQIREKTLLYRKGRGPVEIKGKVVILVDDGAATGATIEAAVKWAKRKHAKKIIVALPVAPSDFIPKIKPEVGDLIVLETPQEFSAVGQFYKNFPQVEDEEVIKLLHPKRL